MASDGINRRPVAHPPLCRCEFSAVSQLNGMERTWHCRPSAVKDIANKGQPQPLPVMPSQNLRRLNSDVRSEELSHQMAFDSQERCAEAYKELARCEQSRHRCRGLSVGLCLRYGQSSAAPERGAGSPAGSRFATQDQTKKKAQTPAARFVHRRASRRSELWA